MRDPLKEFFIRHRPELDTAEPPADTWHKIEMRMNMTTTIAAKSIPWLKHFFFGASAIVVAGVSWFLYQGNNTAKEAFSKPLEIQQAILPPATTTSFTSEKTNSPETSPASQNKPESVVNTQAPNQTLPGNSALLFPSLPGVIENSKNSPPPIQANTPVHLTVTEDNSSQNYEGADLHLDTMLNGITRLEITGSSFDVDVKSHSDQSLHISGNLSIKTKGIVTNKKIYKVTITRKDTVLQVNVVMAGENGKENCVVVGSMTVESLLHFEVPEKTNLVVHTTYGDAKVAGLSGTVCDLALTTGDISLNDLQNNPKVITTYGDIAAANIKGNLFVRTSTGDITLNGLTGNLDITTTYGDQKLQNVTGEIKSLCSTGDVTMTNVTGNTIVKITYGDIALENYKGTPEFSTSTGDIKGKNVELTGNSAFTTTYGDITMHLVNEMDALSFDLATTYGDIHIDKNGQRIEEDHKFSLQKGNIMIRARTSTGDQEYK
jgi:hypothetical protein